MISVAVLGWALRTPLGADVAEVLARVRAGDHAAGEAIGAPADSRHARFLPRLPLLALAAAHEAVRDAGITGGDRTGVFAAVGGLRVEWAELAPALRDQRADGADAWTRGLSRLHPFWMLRNLSNNGHALLAADLGARGEGATFGGATAGAQAIASAARALAEGTIDAAVVVAYDTLLSPELAAEVRTHGGEPSEAAAALVLARDGRARARVRAASVADGQLRAPAAATVQRAIACVCEGDPEIVAPTCFGEIGAAAPVVHAIVAAGLARGSATTRVCVTSGAPGLAAAVAVEAVP